MSMSEAASGIPMMLQWALFYAERGFSIIPTIAGGKRPGLETWKEFEERCPTNFELATWLTGTYRNSGIGLVTGTVSGNIFGVDADGGQGKEGLENLDELLMMHDDFPITWTARSGGGGRHHFFRAPPGVRIKNSTSELAQHVDVRGEGGFLVLPPSPHPCGQLYQWLPGLNPATTEIADAPDWLVALCRDDAHSLRLSMPSNVVSLAPAARQSEAAPAHAPQQGEFNAFGRRIDGREEYMRDLLWARLIEARRESPILPQQAELETIIQECWTVFERKVKVRSSSLSADGRGIEEMRRKLKYAIKKWDTRIADEARKPKPDSKSWVEFQREGEAVILPPTRPVKIRTFTFLQLLTEEVEEEPDYVEPGFAPPGGFTLIAGPPKAQKSFLKQEYHVACATGTSFLCGTFHVPRPLRVFDLQAEMNAKLLRKRARQMGTFIGQRELLQKNLIVSDRFHMILNEDGVKVAIQTIRDAFPNEPPDVISFDPLANIYDQESENDNAQLMRFLTGRLEAVRQIINPLASVTLVHHSMKKSIDDMARDPFIAIRGAGALRGYYDSAIVIFRESEETKARKIHFELRAGESPEPMRCELINGRFERVQEGSKDPILINEVKRILNRHWLQKTPLTLTPNATRTRRAPAMIVRELGADRIKASVIMDIVNELLMAGECIEEQFNSHSKMMGIRVLKMPPNAAEPH